jgi:hypothetical protein
MDYANPLAHKRFTLALQNSVNGLPVDIVVFAGRPNQVTVQRTFISWRLTMKKQILIAAMLSTLGLAAMAQAPASTWDAAHPRRAEVNARLAHQNQRIQKEVASGQITPAQGARLHHEDHQIRQEERAMASQNGGHITRAEQRALNQQENKVSHQIGS